MSEASRAWSHVPVLAHAHVPATHLHMYLSACASTQGCHLGDENLTQANFTAFIFILVVTRPSATHPAPHREEKKKWASLQSLQQAFLPSSPAPLPLSSTVRGTVTPQATVLLPAFKALCLPVWCSLGFLGVFFFPMKEGRHITGKDGSQKTCIHGQGKSPSTESLALTTHLQHAHLHPNMTRYRHISQSVLFNM